VKGGEAERLPRNLRHLDPRPVRSKFSGDHLAAFCVAVVLTEHEVRHAGALEDEHVVWLRHRPPLDVLGERAIPTGEPQHALTGATEPGNEHVVRLLGVRKEHRDDASF
jgi:hypothetical protein